MLQPFGQAQGIAGRVAELIVVDVHVHVSMRAGPEMIIADASRIGRLPTRLREKLGPIASGVSTFLSFSTAKRNPLGVSRYHLRYVSDVRSP